MTELHKSILDEITDFNDSFNLTDEAIIEFAYKGFDPMKILEKLQKINNNKDNLRKDVIKMIAIYLTRGTNVTKMLSKTQSSGRATISTLIGKYSLVDKLEGKPADSINLARVASCFPSITVSALTKISSVNLTRPVTLAKIQLISESFPVCLMFTGVASLIPKQDANLIEAERVKILNAISLYAYEESKVIYTKKEKKSPYEKLMEAAKYVTIANRSDFIPEDSRAKFLISDGFHSVYNKTSGKVTRPVERASNVFLEIMEELSNEDES